MNSVKTAQAVKRKRDTDDDDVEDAKRSRTKTEKKAKLDLAAEKKLSLKSNAQKKIKTKKKSKKTKVEKEAKKQEKEKEEKEKKKPKITKKDKNARSRDLVPEIKTKVFDGPKFNVLDAEDRERSRKYLAEHGFVVMYNVADAKQVESIKTKAFNFMHQANCFFDPKDPSTWTNANTPGMFSTGIIFEDGVGQSPAMWEVRTLPTSRTWYEEYYKCKELLTSFDGMAFVRGAEHRFLANRAWLHTDQDMLSVPDLGYSVQGALNLIDCKNPCDSGSFLVVDKSHLEMKRRVDAGLETKSMSSLKRHFYKLAYDHDIYKQVSNEATPALLVPALAGECVYWLSTTVHANYAPTTGSIRNTARRLVTFFAFAPIHHFPTPMGRQGRAAPATPAQQGHAAPVPRQGRAAPVPPAEKETKETTKMQKEGENKFEKRQAELAKFREARINAALHGMTTSHWPTVVPMQSLRAYPRSPFFAEMSKPLDCLKIDYTPAENALLLGVAPYEADD